jgi:AcrR family transcriptional regulator
MGLTGARVTEAAADLADRIGFDKVTVSAVARGFGVADASLYSHVKNLQDLQIRIAFHASSELAAVLSAAIAGRSGDDALVAFANAYRDFAQASPGRYQSIQMPLDEALLAQSDGHHRLVQACYALLRGYTLAEPEITDAVRLLRSVFHGFFTIEANGGFRATRDLTESWSRIVQALARTLATWPAAPPLALLPPSPGSPGEPIAPVVRACPAHAAIDVVRSEPLAPA